MEWIEGVKLTTLAPEEIRDLVKVGQEAFLIQLLEVRGGAEEEKGVCARS
jgi:aarF domain-containing kinase